jgi:hypothetical protein
MNAETAKSAAAEGWVWKTFGRDKKVQQYQALRWGMVDSVCLGSNPGSPANKINHLAKKSESNLPRNSGWEDHGKTICRREFFV